MVGILKNKPNKSVIRIIQLCNCVNLIYFTFADGDAVSRGCVESGSDVSAGCKQTYDSYGDHFACQCTDQALCNQTPKFTYQPLMLLIAGVLYYYLK